MQPLHLFLLVFTTMTLVISLTGSFQNHYREPLCVSWQWQNLQALKGLDWAMDRAKTLAQVIWPCFSRLAHNQASIFQRAWSMIPMSQCSCCGLCCGCCLMFDFATGGFLGEHWWQMGTSQ